MSQRHERTPDGPAFLVQRYRPVCLVRAGSADEVRAIDDRPWPSLDRITQAVLLIPLPLQDTRPT